MDATALWLTIRLAALTTLLLLVAGLALAWWLSAGRGILRACVQAVVALPLVLPPTVLGFYLLVLLGPLTAPGRLLIHFVGHPLAFTFSGLVVGSVIYSAPFVIQPLTLAFRSVPTDLTEAAAGLGASPARIFFSVTIPNARGGLLIAALLAFLHTVGEFGVVLMIGGNIPGSTRTLSLSLYDLTEAGRYAEANRTAGVLLAAALSALLVIYLTSARRTRGLLA